MRICLFCGSSPGVRPEYLRDAIAFGTQLAKKKHTLVYGGAHIGLMGSVADASLKHGAHVVGIIPDVLLKREIGHPHLSELIIVRSMHERKALMAEKSDGFVILPGGCGTLEEFFEMWTWVQIGIHDKPLVFLNTCGYYDKLLQLIEHMIDEGFVSKKYENSVSYTDNVDELFFLLENYRPVGNKWQP